jgi:MraZ protein
MATQTQSQPIFSGRFRHALDEKKRITVPSKWRASDSDEFFVVPDPTSSFLLVLPPEEFQKVEQQAQENTKITAQERREFIRHFYSNAHQCSTDRQGRMLLPDDHCSQVGLKAGEVVMLIGSLKRIEIWNSKRWDKKAEHSLPTYKKVADLVGL